MDRRKNEFGLFRIAGGDPPTWDLPLPEPFWFRSLPEWMQDWLVQDWETYGPPMIEAFRNMAIIALGMEAAPIAGYLVALMDWWEENIGGTPPSFTPPSNTIVPVSPDGWYPMPLQAEAPDASVGWNPTTFSHEQEIRVNGADTIAMALGRIEAATTYRSRLLYTDETEMTVIDQGEITDGEAHVTGNIDMAVLVLSEVPTKYGGTSFNSEPWFTPRLGTLAFGKDGLWDERQKVEFLGGIYVPRNIARASVCRVKVKPGVLGTLYGAVAWSIA